MDPARLLIARIRDLTRAGSTPLMVALDGRSAAGKSTLAASVAAETGAAVIDGDDFYAGGSAEEWDAMSAEEKVAHCIDWRRQRPVLEALAGGRPGSWHEYDWSADDGRLLTTPWVCLPAPVVILEGVYSARPELADLFDVRVLYSASAELTQRRLMQREGEDQRVEWNARWSEAERWYFERIMPPESFDMVIEAI